MTRRARYDTVIFSPKLSNAGSERTSSDMGASLVQAHTVSVFVEKEKIISYLLYCILFSHHLFCANGQTVRSKNIKYYGSHYFFRQKYVKSGRPDPTSNDSIKTRPTGIWLIVRYVTYLME